MSGHSKWAQIKRQKGVSDVKRGQLFTKLGREIAIAVKEGGPDPGANVRLRLAIQRAKDNNMPMDNIERAIKRASGEAKDTVLEQITYEGYGPNGVAFLVETVTDNRNRTVAEVRNVFNRAGGNLGEAGSVAWLFDSKGVIAVAPNGKDPDELALTAIDAGADDFKVENGMMEVVTPPESFETTRKALEETGVQVENAEVSMVPKTRVPLDEKDAQAILKLIERLEDLDDVQQVYTNAEISDEVMERFFAA